MSIGESVPVSVYGASISPVLVIVPVFDPPEKEGYRGVPSPVPVFIIPVFVEILPVFVSTIISVVPVFVFPVFVEILPVFMLPSS